LNEGFGVTNEEWYDKEVAPKLRELSKLCGDKGMAFIAVVEYAPGERGRTVAIPSNAGTAMIMLNHCANMGENIDGYIIGLRRWARENGVDTSGSIVMNQLDGKIA
jgi:aspartate 1-decarboxylase